VGQAACGNMLLKGEGVPKNVTAAIELYQKSAAQDNIRALNGLGFAYYYGDGVEQVRLVWVLFVGFIVAATLCKSPWPP
jgi:TPR repeat protein